MSYVTIIWSCVASACLTLGAIHLLVWCSNRTAWANAFLFLAAVGTAALGFLELGMMRAETPGQYATLLRWYHIPSWVVVLALVGFVRFHLKSGRAWLAWSICGLRTLSLLANFLVGQNLNFKEITQLYPASLLGESVALPVGTANYWAIVGQLSLLILIIYLVDAARIVWRRGDRLQAILTAGGIMPFVLFGVFQAMSVIWHIGSAPIMISLFIMGVVAMMTYEASRETLRAVRLSAELREHAHFEAVLADLSSEFINLPPDKVDQQIEYAQRRICECVGTEISSLWQWSEKHLNDLVLTNFYGPPDFPGLSERVRASEAFPWCLQQILAGRVIAISSLGEAPAEASRDTEVRRQIGIKSSLVLPLTTGAGPSFGALAFDTMRAERAWPEAIIKRLGLVAQVFANALARKRADKALGESEQRFHQVSEAAGRFIWEVDAEGLYVYANPTVERILGYTPEEIVGKKHFYDLFASSVREELKAAAFRVFSDRQTFRDFPNSNVSKSGKVVHLETSGRPILDSDGNLVGYRGVDTDVTGRKQAELEIEEHRNELAHLARVAMLGELAGSLAHELNQPLMAILSNSQAAQRFLAEDNVDLAELRDILKDIIADDQRAGEIIRRLRLLLKKGEVHHLPLDLNEVVQDVLKLVRNDLLNHNVKLSTGFTRDSAIINGDRVQLQQVLLNLIVNATDAMEQTPPSEKRLLVQTERTPEGAVCVSVVDKGSGLSPEVQEKLFAPFFTTKRSGMGLGLKVCRTIIASHGGQIEAKNNPTKGATFQLTLPVAKEAKS